MARAQGGSGRRGRAIAHWARAHLTLWIVGAAAVDASLIVLVSVLAALPGQSDATVSGLILVLLVLLTLSVVFPVAGHVVDTRDRAAELEHARRERIDRLLVVGNSARLPRLSELSDELLGATPTRYSVSGGGPYISRGDADERIRSLVGAPGPPYPFVIVWGTTKAGKSRTLAEALRAAFGHDPAVVLPRDGQALAELARLGVDTLADRRPAVVVLDDLSPAGLEALTPEVLHLVRGWAVIAATMTAQRRADVIKTGSEVGGIARAALASASGEYELPSGPPTGTERAEAERQYPGERFDGSIAETLVGAEELIARYKASHDSNPAGCAIVRAAIDARRAGVARPVTEAELRRLFPLYLHAVRIDLLPTNDQFTEGIRWATRPVASQVALLRRVGLASELPAWIIFDHAVTADEGHKDHQPRPIPVETWTELIDILPPQDAFAVGITAYTAREVTVAALAFRKATASGHADQAPIAALALGILLGEEGDVEGARAAYQLAIDSGHADWAPRAAVNLGVLLSQQGDVEGARAAYQLAIDSDDHDQMLNAAFNLGNLLREEGDVEGARAAYQLAIDSGHADWAPRAAVNLGVLLSQQGDAEGARAAYQLAIDSGDEDAGPVAAVGLGLLLGENGDVEGARAAYQLAIDSGHDDRAPMAAFNIGVLLSEQGDVTDAQAAYQLAIDSGHADWAARAAFDLGNLLRKQPDFEGARAAYQLAIDSGHPDQAARAAFNLGLLLSEQGDVEGARAAYQLAIDSGHDDRAPTAAINLGNLLREQGDVEGARAAYQLAIDSGHEDAAPVAALGLGNLLSEQGDVKGAPAAYQLAIDSRHPDWTPPSAVNLANLLATRGDVEGARAAYQLAIDSGHEDAAPVAALGLGNLLSEQGDVEGARAAYQLAIDSGHAHMEGAAKRRLAELG